MLADTLDDLTAVADLPPDDYEALTRYLDRCRRVRVGPAAVVFENRRTLWFRVQELARVARLAGTGGVERGLEWYRSLLPGRGRLLASVAVRTAGHDRRSAPPPAATAVELAVGGHVVAGEFLTDSGGDRIIGRVRWVAFRFTAADRAVMADFARPLTLAVEAGGDRHESAPLGPDARASLLADLGPPDGD